MTELFDVEWFGGVAEHHYRKARPEDDLPWESLNAADYPESLVAAAREVWTGVAISEYAAVSSFAAVVHALAAARAPLDLIGMTSDFLADEVHHVELACRLLMRLGGAAPRSFEHERLSPVTAAALTPLQRANELSLRIGCIAETFASETAVPMMRGTRHPLVHAVYESILRDEARHRRFGSLYFEWAGERLDDAERVRLGHVAIDSLRSYTSMWRRAAAAPAAPADWKPDQVHELGWLEPERYVPLARHAIGDVIVPELRDLGLVLPEAELSALLADA
jgi:hypothetical protein